MSSLTCNEIRQKNQNNNSKIMSIKKPQWLDTGQRCWVCDQKSPQPYRKAVIQSFTDTRCSCRFQDGHTQQHKFQLLQSRSNSSTLYQDLMQIEKLNNAELLYHLNENFKAKSIYTYVGNSLLAVNPYKLYEELYGKELQVYYVKKVAEKPVQGQRLAPHVYSVAVEAIRRLEVGGGIGNPGRGQAILISGESGAGKTEANKEVLRFIAKYYGSEDHKVEEKILACNPLLEAFGNAKTIRNDNSSRFGRYNEIQVNTQTRRIHQARILNYLLQKSRLISQLKGQRNFHIFYYLLKGLPPQKLESLGLPSIPNLQSFQYLRGTTFLPHDPTSLLQVQHSLQILPFENSQQQVFRVLASILHIGNLDFKMVAQIKSQVTNPQVLSHICRLLDVSEEELLNALTSYRIKLGGETLTKYFTVNQVREIRDSLSKALYQRLFGWLVVMLNVTMQSKEVMTEKVRRGIVNIGLLDIYGFQVLLVNSFEQLCINFTNERLHQLYIRQVFKTQKQLYQQQSLSSYLTTIQFKDNQPLLDMLDSNPVSIFNLLDQWCSVASPDERSFLSKVAFNHKRNQYFPQANITTTSNVLFIRHTPREVEYNTALFREKNKNLLRDDVEAVLRSGRLRIVREMFVVGEQGEKGSLASNANKIKRFLGSKFRSEMNKLVQDLQLCELHFIRCIKSNNEKQPEYFNNRCALEQIRYLSVLQTIQLRRQSYCIRIPYPDFCAKYHWYSTLVGKQSSTPKQLTQLVIKKHFSSLTKDDLLFGTTKLFLKDYAQYRISLAYRKYLTYLRVCAHRVASAFVRGRYEREKRRKREAVRTVERYVGAVRYAKRMGRLRWAVRVLEKRRRARLDRDMVVRQNANATTLQAYFRRILQYRSRTRKLAAISKICSFYKKHILRRRLFNYLSAHASIRHAISLAIDTVAQNMGFRLQKYLRTLSCMIRNRARIRISIENEFNNLRRVNSRKIERYVRGMVAVCREERWMKAVRWVQRQWRTKVCRREFLVLRTATVKIQRACKEYYFRKVESQRIFSKFFQAYNKSLNAYNDKVRNLLLTRPPTTNPTTTITSKPLLPAPSHPTTILSQHSTRFHNKMSLFYYLLDFQAHIDVSQVYPGDSWSTNYLKLFKQGFEKGTPLQYLQVGETFTMASTATRLYSWGGLVEGDRLQGVQLGEVLKGFRVRKEVVEVNGMMQQQHMECTNKRVYQLQKQQLFQQMKEKLVPVPLSLKVLEIACGNGHIICRTANKQVYTWGHGLNGQLGHGHTHNQQKPRCVQFFKQTQIHHPIQISATFCSSAVLMSNCQIFWFGKNSTINTSTPTPLKPPFPTTHSLPIRLISTWSKTLSIFGATFLSFNGVLDNNLSLRSRLVSLLIAKWQQAGIHLVNPPYSQSIANYLSEASIRMPSTKQQAEMESRRVLRELEEEIREVMLQGSLEFSFSFQAGNKW